MDDHAPLRVHYDEDFDILEIFFQAEPALTIELGDDIYAHIAPVTQQIIGLTIHHFRGYRAEFALPFHGMLVPVSARVAQSIAKALLPP